MMCAQCHVEYNCNAGAQWSDGKKVTYDDQRTNHFPLKNAMQLLEHYKKLDFFDFKHAVTGARLIKLQHPEAETYAGSVHDKAGVQCHQCHMPKQKGKDGKRFSNHGVVRPKLTVKDSCLGCHPKALSRRNSTKSSRSKLHQGEDAQSGVLARPVDRRLCRRPAHGRCAEALDQGPGKARGSPCALGVLDRRELRRLP